MEIEDIISTCKEFQISANQFVFLESLKKGIVWEIEKYEIEDLIKRRFIDNQYRFISTVALQPTMIDVSTMTSEEIVEVAGKITEEKIEMLYNYIRKNLVPYRVQTNTSRYTVNASSIASKKKFKQILKTVNTKEKFVCFLKSIKNYYDKETYPKTFSNYLTQDIWEEHYERALENKLDADDNYKDYTNML